MSFLLALIILLDVFCFSSYAHQYDQDEKLLGVYDIYGNFYLGGEDVGWIIDEYAHTESTTVKYAIYPDFSLSFETKIESAAALWSSAGIYITRCFNDDHTGVIKLSNDLAYDELAALTVNYSTDDDWHFTYWEIVINEDRLNDITVDMIAHEFGHAIGLNDLYEDFNMDKLMYGGANGTATAPTQSDIWGAKVISGQHINHTWSFTYHSTDNYGNNLHTTSNCIHCNGKPRDPVVETCTYTTVGNKEICLKCDLPKGFRPYGNEDDPVTE